MNKVKFPKHLQRIREFMPHILDILQEGHDGYVFVTLDDLAQKSVSASLTDSVVVKCDRGLVMRLLIRGHNFECATNQLEQNDLIHKAQKFREETLRFVGDVEGSSLLEQINYVPIAWADEHLSQLDPLMKEQLPQGLSSQTEVHFGTPFEIDPEETDLIWMSQKARDMKTYLKDKASDSANMVGVLLRQKIKTKIFIDREKNMSQALLTSLAYAYAVSPKGRTVREISGGMAGFEAATLSDADLEQLAKMSVKIEGAELLKPGRYQVITGPDVTGVIAHEAFGHTQEGDTCRYGRSCAPDLKKEGTPVGNEQASIVNNAAVFRMGKLNYGQNGSHFFDDEGQLAREHVILDKGYLQTPMNDLISSLVGDVNGQSPRQSNGKRESWRNPIMARQTNTYFTAGDKTLDELIAMVDDGFLAENAYGGMEDPKGMGLTVGTEYLQEIKQGQLTGRVFLGPKGGHIELSDPVPTLLNGIVAKSKVDDDGDASVTPYNKWGGCGKYHKESVEAGSGGPWILWKGINCG